MDGGHSDVWGIGKIFLVFVSILFYKLKSHKQRIAPGAPVSHYSSASSLWNLQTF